MLPSIFILNFLQSLPLYHDYSGLFMNVAEIFQATCFSCLIRDASGRYLRLLKDALIRCTIEAGFGHLLGDFTVSIFSS